MNMILGIMALISALSMSSVAIFFSVAGIAAVFAAYPISAVTMGTVIEVGKLVAVVWLHYNWHDKAWLRGLFIFFIAGIMFITSMGIFGYLAKSHVEQTSNSLENVAQVERIETEINRNKAIILRANEKIKGYESNGSGVDASLNAQIDKEQERINSAYDRVKPVIQVQLDIIASDEEKNESRTRPFQEELDAINTQLGDLQTALNNKEIRVAQGIVGTQPDGSYGSKTQAAIKDFRTRNEARRNELLQKIDSIRGTPSAAVVNAQKEINRVRASVQQEIDESNATIKSLRSRMGKSNDNDIETLITNEQNKIKDSNAQLDTLTQEKYTLEASYRKLEAEVGPIKHIAAFITGEDINDAEMLEKAVRWFIVLIIFVFDPFAVVLLIAAQHSFDKHRIANRQKPIEVELTQEDEDWLNMSPVGQEFGSPEWDAAEKESEAEAHQTYEPEEIPERYDHADDALSLMDEPKDHPQTIDNIALTRLDNEYIGFNGKSYRIPALKAAFPELKLDFDTPVRSGAVLPPEPALGDMFLRFDIPTELFIFNGHAWNKIDKNVLNYPAYSHEYIKAIIKKVGNGEYNPELLNEAEKKHIEELLGKK